MNHARDVRGSATLPDFGRFRRSNGVGDTGFEPVTSSVSGKRIAQVRDLAYRLTWELLTVDASGHPWTSTPDRE